MTIFAIRYTYDPNRTDERLRVRPDHRAFLTGLHRAGTLLAAGAWADDDAPGGLLVGRAESVSDMAAALDDDPYRLAGVLADREIRPWGQLFGPWSDREP